MKVKDVKLGESEDADAYVLYSTKRQVGGFFYKSPR